MVPDDLGQVIAELIGVALLWQLALEIVADSEAASNGDERHAFAVRSQIRSNTYLGIGWDHAWGIAGAGKANCRRGRTAGIRH